nr:hypothetical protein Iba_chr03dCG1760 [Ipomoea batatas]
MYDRVGVTYWHAAHEGVKRGNFRSCGRVGGYFSIFS